MPSRRRASQTNNAPSGMIDVQILGDSRDVQTRLDGMAHAFSNEAIGAWLVAGVDPILRRRTEERFKSEGDDISGKWQSLTPYTVSDRESHGCSGEHPINVRTGEMKRHLLDDKPRIALHSLGATMWSPGPPSGGDVAKKVKVAQQGDPASNTPARPVLGVGVEDLEAVLLSLGVHIAVNQPGASGGTARDFMS